MCVCVCQTWGQIQKMYFNFNYKYKYNFFGAELTKFSDISVKIQNKDLDLN